MGFSAKQVKALRRNLDHRYVRTREANGRALSYIEGWYAISEANRIFGFDGWSRETTDFPLRAQPRKPRLIPGRVHSPRADIGSGRRHDCHPGRSRNGRRSREFAGRSSRYGTEGCGN